MRIMAPIGSIQSNEETKFRIQNYTIHLCSRELISYNLIFSTIFIYPLKQFFVLNSAKGYGWLSWYSFEILATSKYINLLVGTYIRSKSSCNMDIQWHGCMQNSGAIAKAKLLWKPDGHQLFTTHEDIFINWYTWNSKSLQSRALCKSMIGHR